MSKKRCDIIGYGFGGWKQAAKLYGERCEIDNLAPHKHGKPLHKIIWGDGSDSIETICCECLKYIEDNNKVADNLDYLYFDHVIDCGWRGCKKPVKSWDSGHDYCEECKDTDEYRAYCRQVEKDKANLQKQIWKEKDRYDGERYYDWVANAPTVDQFYEQRRY